MLRSSLHLALVAAIFTAGLSTAGLSLPSPALGHGDLVAEIDRCLAGSRLAVTGNYFDGLAIEDCVQRSFAEWARVSG